MKSLFKSIGENLSLRNSMLLAASVLILYMGIWLFLRSDPTGLAVFGDIGAVVVNSLAVLCLFYAAWRSRSVNRKLYLSWMILAVAQLSYALGDAIWAYYEIVLNESPFPSIADVPYLLRYLLFLAGMLILPAATISSRERLKLALDSGIVMIASILLFWTLIIAPTIEQSADADKLTLFLSVAYPVMDLMLLFALIDLLLRRLSFPGQRAIFFLAIGTTLLIFTDSVFNRQSLDGTYISGGMLDNGWILAYIMIGLAGLSQAEFLKGRNGHELCIEGRYGQIKWPLYIPYLAAAIAFVLLVWSYDHPLAVSFSSLAISVGAIVGLVIIRQIIVLNENAQFYIEAQQEIAERMHAEMEVKKLNEELERRVVERTSQLEEANVDLQSQIHERELAEYALRDSERRLADIINFLPDATFVINKDGVVIAWNRAIEKMTGIGASDILGKGSYEYSLPFSRKRAPMLIDLVLNPGLDMRDRYESIKSQEDGILIADSFIPEALGEPKYLLGSAAVLYDSEGTVYGAIESIRDITARKMAEEDLKSARDRAESATQAKSKFLANMSHEIRTPMNAVIGMTDLLLQMDLLIEQRDYLETIKNSGNALLAIINDILDYSKIDGNKLELDIHPFDLTECIEISMDLVAAKAAEKGLDLTYFQDEDVPAMIVSDEIRLRQVLINLLGNAVKFTEKGEVTLSVGSSKAAAGKCALTFAIKDTGIGISEENLSKLFQSFTQVHSSTNRYYGGTGLGLAISRRLVEMMGGNITVESEPGKGSTFSFTILCDVSLQSPTAWKGETDLYGKSLLIVEGNKSVQRMLAIAAKSWNMSVLTASGGAEAEALLETERCDFVIIDSILPDMEGRVLFSHVRSRPVRPFVVMISHIGCRIARDPSIDGWLSKPVKPRQLRRLMISLLSRQVGGVEALDGAVQGEGLSNKRMGGLQKDGNHDGSNSGGQNGDGSHDGCPAVRNRLSILLAEDNPINQKVALSMLRRLEYGADVAGTGLAVLSALEKKAYDVILMDIQMPDMDGLDATRRIREIKFDPQPYIIAMTAYALEGDREEFLKSGMNDYLSKPIHIEELKLAIERGQAILGLNS